MTSKVRNARVVTPGLVPFDVSFNQKTPNSRWNSVSKEDINAGYAAVSLDSLKAQSKVVEKARATRDSNSVAKNRFIRGTSPKITFDLNPSKLVKRLANKAEARKKIEVKTREVSEKQRSKLNKELRASVIATSSFILRDLVPHTMALKTAVDRAQDVVKQVYNTDLNFPRDYLERKALAAVYLRIIRHVSENFDLTNSERELMVADLRPWVAP